MRVRARVCVCVCVCVCIFHYLIIFIFFNLSNVLNIFSWLWKKKEKKECMYLFISQIYSCLMCYIIVCSLFM